MHANELDVVKLKSGKEGTVVHVFTDPNLAYLVESNDEDGKLLTIQEDEIESIIWRAS